MKFSLGIITTISTLTIFSCDSRDKLVVRTEEEKRNYFQDSIANRMYNGRLGKGDSLNDFTIFAREMLADRKSKNVINPIIYALEENYIDTTDIKGDKCWFRLTVDPTFRIPYCLVVEKKNRRTYLTAKMTDGRGGYYSGKLDFSVTKVFPDTLYDNLSRQLHDLNFWSLGDDRIDGGLDGETWIIEAIEDGKYNLIARWVPQHYGDSTTRQLGRLGIKIRETSKLFEVFAVERNLSKDSVKWLESY
jgi:hypothetical protein